MICVRGPLVAVCCWKVPGSKKQDFLSGDTFIYDLPLIETLKDLLHRVWKEEREDLEEKVEEAKSTNVHSAQRVFSRVGQKLHL